MIKAGKAWVAVRDDQVISIISMNIPNDCDFNKYRSLVTEALKILGDVKTGEVVEVDGEFAFIQRLNHPNRSKVKRDPKVYKL